MLVPYRQVPLSVRNAFANVSGFVARMCRMARTACSAAPLLVHMHEMQICVAVPKIRKVGGLSRQNYTLGVAAEAQIVILFAEGRVELWWIFLGQKAEMLAAVGNMASFAILLGHRAVQELHVFHLSGKRADCLVLAHYDRLVVARQA